MADLRGRSFTFATSGKALSRPKEDTIRILAITENITLDGSIEMLTDWFDPQRLGDIDKSDLLEEEQRQGREAPA